MIELIVTVCMAVNPTMCKPPIQVIPEEGQITSITQCLMGGAIYHATHEGVEWIVKVHCSQK